ncbi:MAG: DUF1517 domain-containing protein [Myxococcota bacterium]
MMRRFPPTRVLVLARRWVVLAFVVLFVGAALPAEARSGGSMGGGFRSRSFSGGSSFGGGGGFSRSFGSSSSGSWGSRSRSVAFPIFIPFGGGWGSHSSYGGGGSAWGGLMFFLIIGGIIVAVVVIGRLRQGAQAAAHDRAQQVDLYRVQLGVQAMARPLQDQLEDMAGRLDLNSDAGLAAMLRRVGQELRNNVESIEYASVEQLPALPLRAAEQRFGDWSTDARGKYDREVLRLDSGGVKRGQKEVATISALHDEDGQFAVHEFFVVSLILALRRVPLPLQINDARDMEALLDHLAQVGADRLVAAEVVWSPASQSDSMSRDDMQLRYPELRPV